MRCQRVDRAQEYSDLGVGKYLLVCVQLQEQLVPVQHWRLDHHSEQCRLQMRPQPDWLGSSGWQHQQLDLRS
jgi:hypothetical protein